MAAPQPVAAGPTIRDLNDAFRRSFSGGRVVLTAGVAALPDCQRAEIIKAVQAFDDFLPDNDPYGDHDFGGCAVGGLSLFWKIDYYDLAMRFGSDDPADPAVTTRVLTVMLQAEY